MAAGAPRVFVSHLSGVAVFDPNGDQVGRVRDVVVMLRVGGRPPRVLGLVVEVVSRRRIFLPMTRVTGVESGQVITTGVVNMRRFEQRPTETLVLGELLDRRVRLVSAQRREEPGAAAWGGRRRRRGHRARRVHGPVDRAQGLGDRQGLRPPRQGRGAAPQGRDADRRLVGGDRLPAGRGQPGRRESGGDLRASCARPTWRTSCTICRPSAAARSPPPWTTTGSPTSWRSCRTTTRWRSSATSRRSGPPTSWRRWTPTTPPTCWPSCRSRSRNVSSP